MAKVPNGVETMPKISIGCVGRTSVTDRRQTDGRRHYSEREPEFTLKTVRPLLSVVGFHGLTRISPKNFHLTSILPLF